MLCVIVGWLANNEDYGRKLLLPKLRKYVDMFLVRLRISKKVSRSCAES